MGIMTDMKMDTARLRATIFERSGIAIDEHDPIMACLLYTSPSPRD